MDGIAYSEQLERIEEGVENKIVDGSFGEFVMVDASEEGEIQKVPEGENAKELKMKMETLLPWVPHGSRRQARTRCRRY